MRRRYRSHLYVVSAAAAIGIAVGIAAALIHTSHSPAAARPSPLQAQITWREGAKPAPGLTLRDQRGASIGLRSLRGQVVLLTFLDSRCKSQCPIEGRVIRDVLRRVQGAHAVTIVVSVDPWADTPTSARSFAAHSGWSGDWHWLLGSKAALRPIWRAYDIGVKRTPGDILHSTALYVIDQRGDLRAGFLFPFSAQAVARNVRSLASGA